VKWWGDVEDALCHFADRRLANSNSPLVLEIVWWRQDRHEGDCGTTYSDTILPRFREKGLIRFAESTLSDCERCVKVLAEGSQASGGV